MFVPPYGGLEFPYKDNLNWIIAKIKELMQSCTSLQEAWEKFQEEFQGQLTDTVMKTLQGWLEDGTLYNMVLENSSFVNVLGFGAKGDGETDDSDAFQSAIDYCIQNHVSLFVPRKGTLDDGGYILSKPLNINYPITIICDPLAVMYWKNAHENTDATIDTGMNNSKRYRSGVGINIDYGTYSGHKGYYRFGILQGDKSAFYIGATVPTGHYWTGVQIQSADLVNFNATYISFWSIGLLIQSMPTGGVENGIFNVQVLDDNTTGVLVNSNTNGVFVNQININTVGICKYGISFNGSSGTISGNTFTFQQIFVECADGACIVNFSASNIYYNNMVHVKDCQNRNTINTVNKFGDDSTFYGDIISGSKLMNLNYGFEANNSIFEIGYYSASAKRDNAVKVIGFNTKITNLNFNALGYFGNLADNAIAAGTTKNIAEFNGDVGALYSNAGYFVLNFAEQVEANQFVNFYVFFRNIPNKGPLSVKLTPLSAFDFVYYYETCNYDTDFCIGITLKTNAIIPANSKYYIMVEVN